MRRGIVHYSVQDPATAFALSWTYCSTLCKRVLPRARTTDDLQQVTCKQCRMRLEAQAQRERAQMNALVKEVERDGGTGDGTEAKG